MLNEATLGYRVGKTSTLTTPRAKMAVTHYCG
jgi:hypothetical protein